MTKNKYYKEYELLKDIPKSPKGRPLRWCGDSKKYYFAKWDAIQKDWDVLYEDREDGSYTREEVESMKDFFKPKGEKYNYKPRFVENVEELKEYYYLGVMTTDGSDDFRRCLSEIVESADFENQIFKLIKKLYEKKFGDLK